MAHLASQLVGWIEIDAPTEWNHNAAQATNDERIDSAIAGLLAGCQDTGRLETREGKDATGYGPSANHSCAAPLLCSRCSISRGPQVQTTVLFADLGRLRDDLDAQLQRLVRRRGPRHPK